jgi:NADH-quinone oxidoreductase subunit N
MNTVTLSSVDFAALSPMIIILLAALGVILIECFLAKAKNTTLFFFTLGSLILACMAAVIAPQSDNPLLNPWLMFDPLAHFFTLFFISIGIAITLLSVPFFRRFEVTHGEYYFLLLSAVFGLILIGAAADFLTLFIGIETLSLSLYVLCAYVKKWKLAKEASMKYFLMGALAAAFLLYGIALIYGAVGTTQFSSLLRLSLSISTSTDQLLFMGGIGLVTLGLMFKASVVPFHLWAPDAYDGAPTPVTAFMSIGTKVGAFAALARVFLVALPQFSLHWNEGVALLAFPTLIYANYVAMKQQQLRRFFAYSGIAQAGFLLIPLAAGTSDSLTALLFYLVIYAFATLGCFAGMAFLDNSSDGVMLDDLRGLFYRSPWLAGMMTICLLTLAGIPPTAGFFGKFYLFKVAFEAHYYTLAIVGLIVTILSAYYYTRIAALMFSAPAAEQQPATSSWPASIVGAVSLAALLFLALYPSPLMTFLSELR